MRIEENTLTPHQWRPGLPHIPDYPELGSHCRRCGLLFHAGESSLMAAALALFPCFGPDPGLVHIGIEFDSGPCWDYTPGTTWGPAHLIEQFLREDRIVSFSYYFEPGPSHAP